MSFSCSIFSRGSLKTPDLTENLPDPEVLMLLTKTCWFVVVLFSSSSVIGMKGGNALAGDCLNGAGKLAVVGFDGKFSGSGSDAVNGDNSSAVSG